jgi:hypothetical protein
MSMNLKRPYHITQPDDSLEKRNPHPCLCGSNDGQRITFIFLRAFLGAGMVKHENLCEKCYKLYKAKQDQARPLPFGPAFCRGKSFLT